MTVTTILSPHPDDAVLSVWRVLSGPGEVRVVNLFAGAPDTGRDLGWWDRLTGAEDPVTRAAERGAEDERALALAGRTASSLDFLDDQYRNGDPTLAQLVGAITRDLPAGPVLAPAALGEHDDHRWARTAGLALRELGRPVSLYADVPHATRHGWPAWVSGDGEGSSPDAAELWDRAMEGTGISLGELEPRVDTLGPDEQARKREAVGCYRTQVEALERSTASSAGPSCCATRSSGRCRRTEPGREGRGADACGLSRAGGIHRARRRARVLGVLRARRDDRPAAADLVARPLAPVEGPDPLPPRHFRVVTFDPRGNGRIDRPPTVDALRRGGVRRATRST